MRKSGGGAAAAGGMDFQNRVAAWVAVHILAEKDATPPWDLSAGTTLEWLRCETGQPVDDLLVGTSTNGLVFAPGWVALCPAAHVPPRGDLPMSRGIYGGDIGSKTT